jgi:hypothetical protein
MNWWRSAEVFLRAFLPALPHLIGLACLMIVLLAPLLGRGPRRSQGRDPWRRPKYQARRTVMEHAGHRCEAATLISGDVVVTTRLRPITSIRGRGAARQSSATARLCAVATTAARVR